MNVAFSEDASRKHKGSAARIFNTLQDSIKLAQKWQIGQNFGVKSKRVKAPREVINIYWKHSNYDVFALFLSEGILGYFELI